MGSSQGCISFSALAGEFLTTGAPGKSRHIFLSQLFIDGHLKRYMHPSAHNLSSCLFLTALSLIFLYVQRFLQRFIDPLAKEEENVGIDITEPLYMQRLGELMKYAYLKIQINCFKTISRL